jgi:hypothetical protein
VVMAHSSTAALGFIWAPLWGVTIFGPIGVGVAMLRRRRRREVEREMSSGA